MRELSETMPPRGILRAPTPDGVLDGRRVVPSAKLAEHVHHFWAMRWSLRAPFTGVTLQHPSVVIRHVDAADEQRTELFGLQSRPVMRTLEGEGELFGITFLPAMFHPLLGASMATLTNRTLSLQRVLGARAQAWTRELGDARTVDEKVAVTEAFLAPLLPPPEPHLIHLRDLVTRIIVDRAILCVEDLSAITGLDERTLQRRFRTYVGMSPKSVIQRCRLLEAAAVLAAPHPPSLADLAASLGYADQAHFGRDFKRTVGETPSAFAAVRLTTACVLPVDKRGS